MAGERPRDDRDQHQDLLKAERRAWIAAHHPDRGGDPALFAAGLARFDRRTARAEGGTGQPRMEVYLSGNPLRRVRRWIRRRRRHAPSHRER